MHLFIPHQSIPHRGQLVHHTVDNTPVRHLNLKLLLLFDRRRRGTQYHDFFLARSMPHTQHSS